MAFRERRVFRVRVTHVLPAFQRIEAQLMLPRKQPAGSSRRRPFSLRETCYKKCARRENGPDLEVWGHVQGRGPERDHLGTCRAHEANR
jgi:hypothetical protein